MINHGINEKFRRENLLEFQDLLNKSQPAYGNEFNQTNNDIIKIDLHCHDHNSDIPDELWGRLLGLPETWISSKELISVQESNGIYLPCITNHNNARSSWSLLNKGIDVLVAAEFTCHFRNHPCSIHVLAYGFNPHQEKKLNRYRHDLYRFLAYAAQEDIPLSLPHPLYYYMSKGKMSMDFFEKFILLFERFEVFNGQRDVWQNLCTWKWINSFNEEKIEDLSKKHGISATEFCPKHPYKKIKTGGSDDHFGLFSGQVGSHLTLSESSRDQPLSTRAIEAIRNGAISPYGIIGEEEKLSVAFMEYFCQVAQNMKDPGLIRLLLHKGSLQDKVGSFILGNSMMELSRHKSTMKFFSVFQDSLKGKKPGKLTRWMVHKDYSPILDYLTEIAQVKKEVPHQFAKVLSEKLPLIFTSFSNTFLKRIGNADIEESFSATNPTDWIKSLEYPLHFRSWKDSNDFNSNSARPMNSFDPSKILDDLSFPALGSIAMASTSFGASRVMYQNRSFMNTFCRSTNINPHPERALWLTDTFDDKNGVSNVLKLALKHIQAEDLPIDILVCSNTIKPQDHLIVVPSLKEFTIPNFDTQKFNFPDLLGIQNLFKRGGYDRILCSTEMVMGGVAIYLKEAFNIPAHFFMHTDWLDFIKRNISLNYAERDRLRRILRGYYKLFDGIFALNNDHKKWLASSDIDIPEEKIHLTKHWADKKFSRNPTSKEECFQVVENAFVLLFAGRLSKEKGAFEVVKIYNELKLKHSNLKLVFAGTGPAEDELKQKVPEALFTGWVDSDRLIQLMSTADFLLLPNKFDTFGCVVLEAMACGTPVCAYQSKGPADIVDHGQNGFLSNNSKEAAEFLSNYIDQPETHHAFRTSALAKNSEYTAHEIMNQLLKDLGL